MRTRAELLQRITERLELRVEADRARWEAMLRDMYAGDERMIAIALEALEDEIEALPGAVLDELLAEPLKQERLH